MTPDFYPVKLWNEDVLCCPRCGDANGLHQTITTLYNGDNALTEVDEKGQTRVWPNDETQSYLNPSSQRHGLTINFECEFCSYGEDSDALFDPPLIRLRIYQHKGQTFMNWELME